MLLILQKYNLEVITDIVELPGAFIIGAGAGPSHVEGVNCEVGRHLQLVMGIK